MPADPWFSDGRNTHILPKQAAEGSANHRFFCVAAPHAPGLAQGFPPIAHNPPGARRVFPVQPFVQAGIRQENQNAQSARKTRPTATGLLSGAYCATIMETTASKSQPEAAL
jgi:hypothetical protein